MNVMAAGPARFSVPIELNAPVLDTLISFIDGLANFSHVFVFELVLACHR